MPNYNDALALEYQREYGRARRNVDVLDFVNNPGANGECSVFGLSVPEQGLDLLVSQRCTFLNHVSDPVLVGQNSVQPLA